MSLKNERCYNTISTVYRNRVHLRNFKGDSEIMVEILAALIGIILSFTIAKLLKII